MHWHEKDCAICHQKMHYLSSTKHQASTSPFWSTSFWKNHSRFSIQSNWRWLCWSHISQIWNGETAHCSQSICMHICISLRKSCAPQGSVWSDSWGFYSNPQKIRSMQRSSQINLEWQQELRDIYQFLSQQKNKGLISQFCAINKTEWHFILERSPQFGGLWEAAVKSAKSHLRKVIGTTKLMFEELATILTL